MNQKKLDEYNLTGSIHTIAIKSPGIVSDVQNEVSACILSNSQTKNGTTTTSIINVNKLNGDVFSYNDFNICLETILAGAGIEDYDVVRADMRFDNYDPDHYRKYSKLNKYLISLLAVTYSIRNSYRTTNLFSQSQLSIAIKNKYFEVENYDKDAESNGTDMAKSRFEERSKSWTDKDIKKEFTEGWFRRWDKAMMNTDKVHKTYNNELERIYRKGKNAYPTEFRSLTDFLIHYQDCIFCKEQMVDLLSRFEEVGMGKAKTRAENHKKRYGIEYFSKSDLRKAVEEIKRATNEYFES